MLMKICACILYKPSIPLKDITGMANEISITNFGHQHKTPEKFYERYINASPSPADNRKSRESSQFMSPTENKSRPPRSPWSINLPMTNTTKVPLIYGSNVTMESPGNCDLYYAIFIAYE